MAYRGNVAKAIDGGRQEESSNEREGFQVAQGILNDTEIHPLDRLLHQKPIRVHVQEFAVIFGIILVGMSAMFAYKNKPMSDVLAFMVGAAVLVVLGYRAPGLLKPVWGAWMKFAEGLGKVMTFLLLSVMWLAMFVPFAIVLRIVGKEVMNMRFREPHLSTYWESRDSSMSDFKLIERQY